MEKNVALIPLLTFTEGLLEISIILIRFPLVREQPCSTCQLRSRAGLEQEYDGPLVRIGTSASIPDSSELSPINGDLKDTFHMANLLNKSQSNPTLNPAAPCTPVSSTLVYVSHNDVSQISVSE